MFVLRSALLWLACGTFLVPTHYCCAFDAAPKPCCKQVRKVAAPATHAKSCCRTHQNVGNGLRSVARSELPVTMCCCRAADPIVSSAASVKSQDLFRLLPSEALPTVAQVYGFVSAVERGILPPEDLQARLCRLRC